MDIAQLLREKLNQPLQDNSDILKEEKDKWNEKDRQEILDIQFRLLKETGLSNKTLGKIIPYITFCEYYDSWSFCLSLPNHRIIDRWSVGGVRYGILPKNKHMGDVYNKSESEFDSEDITKVIRYADLKANPPKAMNVMGFILLVCVFIGLVLLSLKLIHNY